MKAFLSFGTILAVATAAPFHGGHLAHVAHAPVVAAGYHARPAGQVSHQSVSKPYQGEHRSTTQSKAFGSHAAVVADAPNRLHGADAVVAHGVHAVHAPPLAHHGVVAHPVAHAVHAAPVVAHAVHAPVVAHAVHAPVHHAVHAAPAYHAPAPAYHA